MSRSIRCGLSMVVVLALGASAMGQEKLVAPRSLPGDGMIDPKDKVGFFPAAKGGIVAIDLVKGAELWNSKDAERPIFASENRLFALKGKGDTMYVVALDLENKGKRVFESPAIKLPEWVSMEPANGRAFQVGARLSKDSLLVLWQARAFYAGGANPPPEILEQARKEASGAVRIALDSGKATPLDAREIAAGKFFPIQEQMMLIVGDFTFQTNEDAATAQNPARRFLEALNASMEVVWRREIAMPVVPLPAP